MDATGLAGIITAVGSVIGAVTAGGLVQRGRKESLRDQDAADRLRERQQEQNYFRQQVQDQRTVIDRQRAENADLEAENEKLRARLRTERVECDQTARGLIDAVRTLQSVVADEVAKAAAGAAVEEAEDHSDDHVAPL